MLKLLSFSGCGRDKNGESVFERYRSLAGHMTRHPRTFITTAPSSAQATRRRSSSRDPSSTPAICTSPASSARYISSARRATSNLAPSHVPCPPRAARADRAQPPEPHTSPAAHPAGAAQAPDSAPPPQAPAATGSGGLKVTTHALHMSDHCMHLFLRRLARPALNSRAH